MNALHVLPADIIGSVTLLVVKGDERVGQARSCFMFFLMFSSCFFCVIMFLFVWARPVLLLPATLLGLG